MTFTKVQAAKLWCPMVRHIMGDEGTFNRGSKDNNPANVDVPPGDEPSTYYGCHCLADGCAMWQWHMDARTLTRALHHPCPEGWTKYQPDHNPDRSCWLEPQEQADARRTGSCGLTRPVQ
jgi:hypothetical protein